jgi:hypothetical protein
MGLFKTEDLRKKIRPEIEQISPDIIKPSVLWRSQNFSRHYLDIHVKCK